MHDIRLQELRLTTDYGRCCRPLFVVDRQELVVRKRDIAALAARECDGAPFGWEQLVGGGLIE